MYDITSHLTATMVCSAVEGFGGDFLLTLETTTKKYSKCPLLSYKLKAIKLLFL